MYPVSATFQEQIKKLSRRFEFSATLDHEGGSMQLTDEDIVQGSLGVESATTVGDEFDIGGAIASDLSLSLVNKDDKFTNVKLNGAKITPWVKLVPDGVGGRNLARNTNTDLWDTWAGNVTKRNENDTWILKSEANASSTFGVHQTSESRFMELSSGEEYVLSFEVRGDISSLGYVYIMNVNTSNQNIGRISGFPISEVEFTKVYKLFTKSESTAQYSFLMISAYASDGTWFEVKNIKLEKGNKATDWTPAPEDYAEPVPLGVFTIDESGRPFSTISVKAVDNMVKFDKPYSKSNLSYPATLMQIYQDACSVCDVLPATTSFINSDYMVPSRPEGQVSFRDIISYIAQLSGSFARIDRTGKLELAWYDMNSTYTLEPMNRASFKPDDNLLKITGIICETESATYIAGTEDYAIDLSENLLLQSDHERLLGNIYNKVKAVEFYPFESEWQGNPAVQQGDVVTHTALDGKVYKTIITHNTYKYRGKSYMSAKGISQVTNGYKGELNKKMANMINRIRTDKSETDINLTDLENQIIQATNLIAGSLGGYAFKIDGVYYVADSPDINTAQKVWKWGIGGFGYSENGIAGPYTTGITSDGSIVAKVISAMLISADMIKAGILQSEDGNTWINLDNGKFNLANKLIFDGTTFKINYAGTDLENALDGKASKAIVDEMKTYMDFDEVKGMTIGRAGSPLQVAIDNQSMQFLDDGTAKQETFIPNPKAVAYINGKMMYITDLQAINSLIVGVHKLEKYNNMTLIKYIG